MEVFINQDLNINTPWRKDVDIKGEMNVSTLLMFVTFTSIEVTVNLFDEVYKEYTCKIQCCTITTWVVSLGLEYSTREIWSSGI